MELLSSGQNVSQVRTPTAADKGGGGTLCYLDTRLRIWLD